MSTPPSLVESECVFVCVCVRVCAWRAYVLAYVSSCVLCVCVRARACVRVHARAHVCACVCARALGDDNAHRDEWTRVHDNKRRRDHRLRTSGGA